MGMLIHRHLIEMVELPDKPIEEAVVEEQDVEIPAEKPKTATRKTATKTKKPVTRKRTVK